MSFESESQEINFDPNSQSTVFSNCHVENSIVTTILQGSGVLDSEMSDPGLRFIRYLLSISRSARRGFVPNFQDLQMVRKAARDFIDRCGGKALALQAMQEIVS